MTTVSIQANTFNLPDLGEGLTEAELVTWKVAVGESVALDQVIAEVETAKSLVEVPTPYAGTVLVLHGAEGETLAVGRPLITVGPEGSDPAAFAAGSAGSAEQAEGAQSYREEERAGSGSGNVLIGYGTSEEGSPTRRRRGRRAAHVPVQASGTASETAAESRPLPDAAASAPTETSPSAGAPAPALAARVVNPLVRRLARDMGVDVAALSGSGPDGLVMRADVHAAASGAGQAPAAGSATQANPASSGSGSGGANAGTASSGAGAGELDKRSGLGIASRTPITGVRKVVAQTMSRSRREIPEATVWVDVDATELLKLRRGIRPDANGRRPGVLAIVGRFVAAGLQRVPELNSRIEQAADGSEEIVTLDGVNLGIAAQTERGLVVPAVERAERLSARELDAAIAELINTAREGKCTPAQLTRGTFTLNNYGVFDVDGSAAIINHPQVAILGLGRIKARPWVVDGEIVVREITELTLSFDHRVCDGGAASRFLRFVADAIERPGEALAEL
ncbi:dihydrolipoamide acetyltransferase family protein [Galactobacter caseinivorans]|uniref:Dihydrolipoamide acetyltransferase component of pyruvate dehydrogenase complex n=1 Tax=Galactobacter caseinivorans TaxID=2676123 RepID=A0A496PLJ2_9MICC|nr:dihydrolipoamide acetyltransferase family protein [Galactobacter caseinivorans]RKW71393.1 2-oxo acid dehydrogenase subunit E2 [Galactobacter caseinivorans]